MDALLTMMEAGGESDSTRRLSKRYKTMSVNGQIQFAQGQRQTMRTTITIGRIPRKSTSL